MPTSYTFFMANNECAYKVAWSECHKVHKLYSLLKTGACVLCKIESFLLSGKTALLFNLCKKTPAVDSFLWMSQIDSTGIIKEQSNMSHFSIKEHQSVALLAMQLSSKYFCNRCLYCQRCYKVIFFQKR